MPGRERREGRHDEGAAWLADLEDELAGFPNAVHDDIVDSITQALNHFRENSGAYGWLDWIAGVAKGIFAFPDEPKESPRGDLVGQKLAFQAEMKARGVYDPGFAPVALRVPQTCPACKSKRTTPIPGNQEKCDDCATQFFLPGAIRPLTQEIYTRSDAFAGKLLKRR
jgi:hypothetical protein